MNEVEPILVIFEDRKEKEQVANVMMLLVDGGVFKPLKAFREKAKIQLQ